MSDYEVTLVNDNMQEFYVRFHGPKESEFGVNHHPGGSMGDGAVRRWSGMGSRDSNNVVIARAGKNINSGRDEVWSEPVTSNGCRWDWAARAHITARCVVRARALCVMPARVSPATAARSSTAAAEEGALGRTEVLDTLSICHAPRARLCVRPQAADQSRCSLPA